MKTTADPHSAHSLRFFVLVFTIVLSGGCASRSSLQHGSLPEAEAMLGRAVVHYQQVGREQALSDFTAPATGFIDRDLYVFCYGPDRKVSAHGVDRSLIGLDVDQLRDVDGKHFGTEIMSEAMAHPDGGRVEYKWLNPAIGKVERKVSFVRAAGTDVCGVGAYLGE